MNKQIPLWLIGVAFILVMFFLHTQGWVDFSIKPDSPWPNNDGDLLMANHNSLATLSHERAVEVGKAEFERIVKFDKILKNPPAGTGPKYGDVIMPYRNDAIKNILTLIRLGKIKPADMWTLEEYQKIIQEKI